MSKDLEKELKEKKIEEFQAESDLGELKDHDFIPYSEVDNYVQYLGRNLKIPGFRKGKVFLPILYNKFPNAIKDIISFYIQLKVSQAQKYNKTIKIEEIKEKEEGFRIKYLFEKIKNKEESENQLNNKTEQKID